MTRLLPQSLRGWLILIVLSTLALSQSVMFFTLLGERGSIAADVHRTETFSRIQSIVAQLDEADPESYEAIRNVAGSPTFELLVSDFPIVTEDIAESWSSNFLAQLIGDEARDIRVYRPRSVRRWPFELAADGDNGPNGTIAGSPETTDGLTLLASDEGSIPDNPTTWVSIQLVDGSWLNVTAVQLPANGPLSRFMLAALAVAIALTLLSVWGANRVARPLKYLGDAASRIGGEEDIPPIPEAGPADVRRLTRSFNEMAARVRRTMTDQRTLLRSVGHDLRSPLTSMRIRLEFVHDDKLRDQLIESVEEMEALTSDALEAARGEVSSETSEVVEIGSIIRAVCEEQRALGNIIAVSSSGDVWIDGRRRELRRAIRNLVENATIHGGGAEIRIDRDGSFALISVCDDGPGIPDKELARMLEPFAQLDEARTRSNRGSGLGLSIARGIVERHGGKLELMNRQSGGLRATLRLSMVSNPNTDRHKDLDGALAR